MKKIFLTFVLFIGLMMFTVKANAMTAICYYGSNPDSFDEKDGVAVMYMDGFNRKVFFNFSGLGISDRITLLMNTDNSFTDTFGIATALGVPPVVNQIERMNQALTRINYISTLKKDGIFVRLDPLPSDMTKVKKHNGILYVNGYFESDNIDGWDSKLTVKFGSEIESNDSASNYRKFAQELVCPDVIYMDNDSPLQPEKPDMTFSYDPTQYQNGSLWEQIKSGEWMHSIVNWAGNNKVYYKKQDLVADNYRNSTMMSTLKQVNEMAEKGTCTYFKQDNIANYKRLINAFNFNLCYNNSETGAISENCATLTEVEKHNLAKTLGKNDDFNFYGAAEKIIEHESSIQTCHANQNQDSVTGEELVKAAKNFKKYYDGKVTIAGNDVKDCKSILGDASNVNSPAFYLTNILKIMRFVGIVLAIVLTTMDAVKVISTSDADGISKLIKTGSIRLIFAGLLFFGLTIVNLLLDIFHIASDCGIN